MDQVMKDRWTKALRSGRYEQSAGNLRVKHSDGSFGYCCLGVLKDLTGVTWTTGEDVDSQSHSEDTKEFVSNYQDDLSNAKTSYFAAEDLDKFDGDLFNLETLFTYPSNNDLAEWGLSRLSADKLVEMNDSGSDDFEAIADWIQDHDLTVDE